MLVYAYVHKTKGKESCNKPSVEMIETVFLKSVVSLFQQMHVQDGTTLSQKRYHFIKILSLSGDSSHNKIGVFIYFKYVSSKLLKCAFLLLKL